LPNQLTIINILGPMKKLFFILLILINTILLSQDNVYFIIRVDDIQSRNTTTLPKSINAFQDSVAARGGLVTWAVIPHRIIEALNTDGALIRDLKQSVLKGNEISLHGYNHICTKCGSSGHEMVCTSQNYHFPLTEQLKLIDDGLKILKDSLNYVPASFVPPAHQADTITYQALIDRKIDLISTTSETKNIIFKTLYNLSPNNEYTWSMTSSNYQQNLKTALKDIKTTAASKGYYCLLLHDPFIRAGYENGIVIKWVSELLDSLNIYYGTKIKYTTISRAANIFRQQSTAVSNASALLSQNYQLMQNFPNPFNPVTTISYNMPKAGSVKISIFNSLGQLISQPVNEFKNAGTHITYFDGSNYAAGIYFYTMQCGSFIQTRKFVLLK